MNCKQVIDSAFSRIKDNSAALRVKMLSWLNSTMREVVNDRAWTFLDVGPATLPITSNAVTLPTDFGQETFVKYGIYTFTTSSRLTPTEAARADLCGGDPVGYTIENGKLTIHPSAEGTLDLSYTAKVPAAGYADDTTATIFPDEFIPLFERYLLSAFYEYDADPEKLNFGAAINQSMLRNLRIADNQRRPVPALSRKGMLRGN